MARQLGVFLKTLHGIDAEEAQSLGAPPDTLARLDVTKRSRLADTAIAHVHGSGLLDDFLAASLQQRITRIVTNAPQPRARVLVHGDLYSRHVMTESEVATGIIDWGDVHIDDPAADLAGAWAMFSSEAREAFLDEYGPVKLDTRELAVLRAIGHTLSCLRYAHDIRDEPLLRESRRALERVLEE